MSDTKPPVDTISSYDPTLWDALKETYRLQGTGGAHELPTAPLRDWVRLNVPLGEYVQELIPQTKQDALVDAATALIPAARSAAVQKKALQTVPKQFGPSIRRTGDEVLMDTFGNHPSYPRRLEALGQKTRGAAPPRPRPSASSRVPSAARPSVPLDSDFVTRQARPRPPRIKPWEKDAAQTVEDTIDLWGPYSSPDFERPLSEHLKKAFMGSMVDLGAYLAKLAATPEGEKVREPEAERLEKWAQERGSADTQAEALEAAPDQTVDPTYGSWKNKTTDVSKMTPEELSAYVASLGG